MSDWIESFIENYSNYKKTIKCIEKNGIDKQVICLLRLNKKKKKGKGKR
ncbi:hypothetical protein ES708_01390 [subsurface metagenome]